MYGLDCIIVRSGLYYCTVWTVLCTVWTVFDGFVLTDENITENKPRKLG